MHNRKIEKTEEHHKNEIRALYNSETIRVYQAYSNTIADEVVKRQSFKCTPFKMDRMTWIKPSFLWMMYRSGWGEKDLGQSRILSIDILRTGFDWAISHGCLSSPSNLMTKEEWIRLKNTTPVRIQWDPERDLFLKPQNRRTIQIGLSKIAVEPYVNEWIQSINDITDFSKNIKNLVLENKILEAQQLLPKEIIYP